MARSGATAAISAPIFRHSPCTSWPSTWLIASRASVSVAVTLTLHPRRRPQSTVADLPGQERRRLRVLPVLRHAGDRQIAWRLPREVFEIVLIIPVQDELL